MLDEDELAEDFGITNAENCTRDEFAQRINDWVNFHYMHGMTLRKIKSPADWGFKEVDMTDKLIKAFERICFLTKSYWWKIK